jgi:hypothetical protein
VIEEVKCDINHASIDKSRGPGSGSFAEEWPITGGRRTKQPQVEESLQIYKLLL